MVIEDKFPPQWQVITVCTLLAAVICFAMPLSIGVLLASFDARLIDCFLLKYNHEPSCKNTPSILDWFMVFQAILPSVCALTLYT